MDKCPRLTELAEVISERDKTIFKTAQNLLTANTALAELRGRLEEELIVVNKFFKGWADDEPPENRVIMGDASDAAKRALAQVTTPAPAPGDGKQRESQQCNAHCPYLSCETFRCCLAKGHSGPHNYVSALGAKP